MATSTDAAAYLLNHVELFHRPGERDLAARLFETMGCTVADVTKEFGSSTTYLCVYPGPVARDPLNNAVYLSELREEQRLEKILEQRKQDDAELRAALEACDGGRTRPGLAMHFGLRYSSFEELAAVMDRLQHHLPDELTGRVTVHAPFAYPLPALGREVMQGFVHTSLVGTGLFPFGQLIELQAQRPVRD